VKNIYDINDTKLIHRNRNKVQQKTYIYEDMKEIIRLDTMFTVSQFMFATSAMTIEVIKGYRLPYIKDSDRLIFNNLRRAISHNK